MTDLRSIDDICRQLAIKCFFFFQAEDGIRDLVRSRGLGDVYKRQTLELLLGSEDQAPAFRFSEEGDAGVELAAAHGESCLLYTSDAADERSSVDLGGRRIIKKKKIELMSQD